MTGHDVEYESAPEHVSGEWRQRLANVRTGRDDLDYAPAPAPGGRTRDARDFPGDVAITRITDRLDETGRTSKDVAEVLGISEKHLSQILTGHADPSYALARRLWREVMA